MGYTRRRRPSRILMIKYTVTVTEQFVRDKRIVIHAQNEGDLLTRLEDRVNGERRRLDADEGEILNYLIEDEQRVL